MTTDTFIRDRFAWLDQVGADHTRQSSLAFRVAYSIARHLNRTTGEAFPGQDRIARECGVTKTAARNAIARLVKNGHLRVTQGNGRGFSNHYRPILRHAPERCNEDCTLSDQKVQQALHDTASKGATVVTLYAEKVQRTFPEGATPVATNPLKNSEVSISRNLSDTYPQEPSPSKSTERDNGFDNFWAIYPRRDAKGRARPAFATALKKASLETILASTKRYAAERQGKDAQYTKLPATWLNGECWGDQSLTAPGNATQGYADSTGWSREKFEDVIRLSKGHGEWFRAYGDPANIPPDLIDAELQAILSRIPKPYAQVVA